MRTGVVLAAVAGTVAMGLTGASGASAATGSAQITVVHGLRGVVADMNLDGKPVLSGFSPERITNPITVTATSHVIDIRAAGSPASSPPAVTTTVDPAAGARLTVAVGLNGAGTPFARTYDDAGLVPDASSSALVVRNVADVGPWRLRVDGHTSASSVANGSQEIDTVTAGSHTVSLVGANGSVVMPAQTVPVSIGSATVLYLIGASSANNLDWLATTVASGQAAVPSKVEAGNSGRLTSSEGLPAGVWALFGAAALGIAGLTGSRRRRRAAARAS